MKTKLKQIILQKKTNFITKKLQLIKFFNQIEKKNFHKILKYLFLYNQKNYNTIL